MNGVIIGLSSSNEEMRDYSSKGIFNGYLR
jgi:hypothetical protein